MTLRDLLGYKSHQATSKFGECDEEEVSSVDHKKSAKPGDPPLTPDSAVKVAPDVLFSEVQG